MIKSLYNKNSLSQYDILRYIAEDNDECSFFDLDNEITELNELCIEYNEFDKWLKNQSTKRHIEYIVVHCTATDPSAKVSSILNYWKNTMKWMKPGYHILIKDDGSFSILSDIIDPTNGVYGYNYNSIHISYIGGVDKNNKPYDTRTEEQKNSLRYIVKNIHKKYGGEIKGHKDFYGVRKACPSFGIEDL